MSKIWASKNRIRTLNNARQQKYSTISEFPEIGDQIDPLFYHFMYGINLHIISPFK